MKNACFEYFLGIYFSPFRNLIVTFQELIFKTIYNNNNSNDNDDNNNKQT